MMICSKSIAIRVTPNENYNNRALESTGNTFKEEASQNNSHWFTIQPMECYIDTKNVYSAEIDMFIYKISPD